MDTWVIILDESGSEITVESWKHWKALNGMVGVSTKSFPLTGAEEANTEVMRLRDLHNGNGDTVFIIDRT